jgi:hypothetical protein
VLTALVLLSSAVGAQQVDSTRAGVARPAPTRRGPRVAPPDSTLRPPISPRRAFLYSLFIPGLGQAKLDRPNAAALFVGVELLSIAMARKTSLSLDQAARLRGDSVTVGYVADSTASPELPDPLSGQLTAVECTTGDPTVGSPEVAGGPFPVRCATRYTVDRVRARRLQLEDWFAALIFNHLLSGADAFVAAQLWDLPGEVSMRAHPRGLTVDAALPW